MLRIFAMLFCAIIAFSGTAAPTPVYKPPSGVWVNGWDDPVGKVAGCHFDRRGDGLTVTLSAPWLTTRAVTLTDWPGTTTASSAMKARKMAINHANGRHRGFFTTSSTETPPLFVFGGSSPPCPGDGLAVPAPPVHGPAPTSTPGTGTGGGGS